MMQHKPILFSASMVRAILDGRKTQTRRTIKPQPESDAEFVNMTWETTPDGYQHFCKTDKWWDEAGNCAPEDIVTCPYGMAGDFLWVREAFACYQLEGQNCVAYRATNCENPNLKWKPSIHMPKLASRLTLEITNIRVARLQNISDDDAIAEGISYTEDYDGYHTEDCRHFHGIDPRISFWSLWEHINGAESLEANPWVWVVEFKAHMQNIQNFIQQEEAA